MALNFDTSFSFDNQEIKKFLIAQNSREHTVEPEGIAGFSHDAANERPSLSPDGQAAQVSQDIVFLQEEIYQLFEGGSRQPTGEFDGGAAVGLHRVIVALKHQIDITTEFWLFLRDTLDADARSHAAQVFHGYDPQVHGENIDAYMQANLGGVLTEQDFELETAIRLRKQYGTPDDKDISQRIKLFDLLDCNDPPGDFDGRIDIDNMEMGLPQWSGERSSYLKLISTAVVMEDSEPPADPNTDDTIADPDDLQAVGNAIDMLMRDLIPSSCGRMRRREIRLLTIASWPEFRIKWVKRRIKVGCSRITITVPVLQIRISRLVFYAYFKIPVNVGQFVMSVATVCAKRSALTSAVIGVVTSNLAAAMASFTPLFKRCIETEVRKCLYPGLFLAKKPGNWS